MARSAKRTPRGGGRAWGPWGECREWIESYSAPWLVSWRTSHGGEVVLLPTIPVKGSL